MMTKVWILTEEYDYYDQYGSCFVAVFAQKPTREQLMKHQVDEEEVEQVLAGGGRKKAACHWWWLTEIEPE